MTSQNQPLQTAADPSPAAGERPVIRVASPADLLDAVPYLLGFHPDRSIVVVAFRQPPGQFHVAFRYDLPDPPATESALDIAGHAAEVLTRSSVSCAAIIGYGARSLVAPVFRQISLQLATAGIMLIEALRAEGGRYWSYVCQNPDCCPPEGVPFGQVPGPAAVAAVTLGLTALPSRAHLAATIAPQDGPARRAMRHATTDARRWLARLARDPANFRAQVTASGRDLISAAVAASSNGDRQSDSDAARLSVLLTDIRVRDEAWAQIDPAAIRPHLDLWSDMTRRAVENVAACASLLAFAAWTAGDGALASIAIERALAADPGYSMARLIAQALQAGMPR